MKKEELKEIAKSGMRRHEMMKKTDKMMGKSKMKALKSCCK